MKGIMRKRLLGLLSVVGLASSSTPASAQVLKGAQPTNTKSESTIKASKRAQEDAASKDAAKMTKVANEAKASGIQAEDKHKIAKSQQENASAEAKAKIKLSSVEGGHATPDVVNEKHRKAGAEQKALKGAAEVNAGKSGAEEKWRKTGAEKTAVSNEVDHKDKTQMGDGSVRTSIKVQKNAAELKAGQHDANIKLQKQNNQASPK